jgi:mannitol/fructose-specific phosphotransferase system IIA component (Ntr-type)
MSREVLNLKEAALHVHLEPNELKHAAQRGEVEAFEHGGEWHFPHRQLDEWAQRNMLAASNRELKAQHRVIMDEHRRDRLVDWCVADLFAPASIDLQVGAKAKAGIIRDMTDLAEKSGYVYDTEGLFKELVAREEAASTAVGAEVALLHPRFHDPYMFEQTFVAYGRSERAIFFGAPDGAGTRHFFLICSTDHEQHLHILARLAVLAHGTECWSGLMLPRRRKKLSVPFVKWKQNSRKQNEATLVF